MTSIGRSARYAILALGALWPMIAMAQLNPQNPPAPCTGGSAPAQTRTSCFKYDTNTGLLVQEVIEPGTPSLQLQTDYAYDASGNKIQVMVSGSDIAARLTTTSYSGVVNGQQLYPNGQFQTSATNALSQSESWQYDPRFGKPTQHTGPNGIVTIWKYDAFGRKILEQRGIISQPNNQLDTHLMTQTQFTYTSCAGGNCPCQAGSMYAVGSVDLSSSGAQIGPDSYVHYDSLDREIYRFTRSFDGSHYIEIQTQYDGLGRVAQKTRPFMGVCNSPNSPPQVTTTYSYDALARVTKELLPDLNTITHTYHGLVTTDTNQNNQTRTVKKNSQGQVVSVSVPDPQVNGQQDVTTYYYDPFGNQVQTVDATGKNVVVNSYDLRGRKTASSDPDLGAWTYSYNTLSQLVSQTDAKSQPSQFTYDLLGRLTQRVEADMTASWTYDTAPYGIGKLASASASGLAAGTSAYQRQLTYDTLSRPCQVATTIDGAQYVIGAGNGTQPVGSCNANAYDANGRLAGVTYPSGFAVTYGYTSMGYVRTITDATSGQTYWTANQRDAEFHLTQDTAGNGIVTARGFDAPTGRLTSIVAGSGNGVANFSYSYDGVGNLLSRNDGNAGNAGLLETFGYDSLNRLTESSIGIYGDPVIKYFSYDSVGNLLLKSDVGNYAYPEPGLARPHGVLSIDGDLITATFSYDANGNQTNATGIGRSMAYNAANKPTSIRQGSLTLNFADDVDHQRYKQTVMQGATVTTTQYFDAFGVHTERVVSATTQWNDYIMVGGSMVGVRFLQGSTVTLRYFHQDHLGSIAVLTDQNGAVVERGAYDPWGKRRYWNNGADDTAGILPSQSQTIRGFTGQEMLASVGLVHLNGRVYDPYIGRMTSADPVVGDALNGQTWNRYSYVYNNPLAFTDPTGYCPICLGTFFSRVANGIGKFLQRNPLVGQVLVIAAAALCGPGEALCAGIAATAANFVVTGLSTGRLDMALKAAAVTAATAAAFYGVGDLTQQFLPIDPETGLRAQMQFGDAAHAFNIAGHALVGCGASVAAGGKCGPGALSGAVPSLAGPLVNTLPFQAALTANSTLGGLASVAGGGKFLNGAVTGAFGYLMNWRFHEGTYTVDGIDIGNDAHRTLEAYALANVAGTFAERYGDGQGTWFGGRVDIGNIDPIEGTRSIMEIKSAAGVSDGILQVLWYSLTSALTGQAYMPSTDFLFANRGVSQITLPGAFGIYTFTPAAPGVAMYQVEQMRPNVESSPSWVGGQRSLVCISVCVQ